MFDPEQTWQWLKRDDVHYQFAIGMLVEQMHAAVHQRQTRKALEYSEELKFTACTLAGDFECAQARLECARVYFNLNQPNKSRKEVIAAIRLLSRAPDSRLQNSHYCSMAYWMLGSLLLQHPQHHKNAITSWQSSLNTFELLLCCLDLEPVDPAWYRDRCAEMRQAIEKAVKGQPVKPRKQTTRTPRPKPAGFTIPISTLYAGRTKSLPVVGQIPAGGFGPSRIAPHHTENVQLGTPQEEFFISGKPHQLYNLRGSGGITRLNSTQKYFILEVIGDSMDKAFIEPGDYVLMRQQDDVDSGDIVAAEIVNTDTQATLKRFRSRSPRVIELHPESTNKKHKMFAFTRSKGDFYIRGLALGVFKQI